MRMLKEKIKMKKKEKEAIASLFIALIVGYIVFLFKIIGFIIMWVYKIIKKCLGIDDKTKNNTKPMKKRKPRRQYDRVVIGYGNKVLISPNSRLTDHVQVKLAKIYEETGGKMTKFSITPECDYQIEMGWPRSDSEIFVNVNIYPSTSTTKANWLGFIGSYSNKAGKHLYVAQTCIMMMNKGKLPVLMGRVVKEDDDTYSIILGVSRKSVKEELEKLAQPSWILL